VIHLLLLLVLLAVFQYLFFRHTNITFLFNVIRL
jgi:hypothetical protein